MRIIGIDPGFSTIGLVSLLVNLDGEFTLEWASLLETKPSESKIPASEDNMNRASIITDVLMRAITSWSKGPVNMFGSEEQSWPRNASSALKVAHTWGIMSALSTLMEIPIIQTSPKQLKKQITGDSSASKEMVEMFVDSILNGQLKSELSKQELAKGKWNHVYDAAGAAICAWRRENA